MDFLAAVGMKRETPFFTFFETSIRNFFFENRVITDKQAHVKGFSSQPFDFMALLILTKLKILGLEKKGVCENGDFRKILTIGYANKKRMKLAFFEWYIREV